MIREKLKHPMVVTEQCAHSSDCLVDHRSLVHGDQGSICAILVQRIKQYHHVDFVHCCAVTNLCSLQVN